MRAARAIYPKPATSAVERARRVWADMARETRCELRSMGVHGALRNLTEATSGTRGKAAPQGLYAFAREMRDNGIPMQEAAERLADTARMIAMLTYHDSNGAA